MNNLENRILKLEKKKNNPEIKGDIPKILNQLEPNKYKTQKDCIKALQDLFF